MATLLALAASKVAFLLQNLSEALQAFGENTQTLTALNDH